jgi:hypothetical protein
MNWLVDKMIISWINGELPSFQMAFCQNGKLTFAKMEG